MTKQQKKPPESEVLSIRMPKPLADWVRETAARERRQIGAQFSLIVEQAMEKTK